MQGQSIVIERVRWLAFVPAIWLSSIVHNWIIEAAGAIPGLTSLDPAAKTVSRAGVIWGVSEGITVIAAMAMAVMFGPRRHSLFQMAMIALFYVAAGLFNLKHLDVWDYPALRHAVSVDCWTGMLRSVGLLLCGVIMSSRYKREAPAAGKG